MQQETTFRRVLWASALFNLGGGLLFAFPSSLPSQLVGLPTPVPAVDSTVLVLFIILFGGA